MLGRSDYLDAARGCAGFVLEELRDDDGRLLRSWKDGQAKLNAYLEDHAFLLEALLTLYESTFEPRWFAEARALADSMIERFADEEKGGFFETSSDHERLVARRKDLEDHPIPAGNSSAAYGLLRLAALTGEHRYEERAVSALRLLHELAPQHPQAFGHLLQALDFHLSPVREVALVGDDLDPLERVVRSRSAPTSSWQGAARTVCRCSRAAGRSTAGRPRTCASTSPASAGDRARRARTAALLASLALLVAPAPSAHDVAVAARLLGPATGGERRRGAGAPARRAQIRAGRPASRSAGARGAGTRLVAQRDRRVRHHRVLPAHRDGPRRHDAERARRERQRLRASRWWPSSPVASSGSGPPATSGSWPPAPRSGSTRARRTTSVRSRSPAGCARGGRARSTGRSRSTRSAATGRSGCARLHPASAPAVEGPLLAPPGARGCPSAGSPTRGRATPTTASSSCSACRQRSSASGPAASPAATAPATGASRLDPVSLRQARRLVAEALRRPAG